MALDVLNNRIDECFFVVGIETQRVMKSASGLSFATELPPLPKRVSASRVSPSKSRNRICFVPNFLHGDRRIPKPKLCKIFARAGTMSINANMVSSILGKSE